MEERRKAELHTGQVHAQPSDELCVWSFDGDWFAVLEQAGAVGADGIGAHFLRLFQGAAFGVATGRPDSETRYPASGWSSIITVNWYAVTDLSFRRGIPVP